MNDLIMALTPHQDEIFNHILDFFQKRDEQICILNGPAGVGKTFLISHLANELLDSNHEVCLLTPTGRAARILSQYTSLQAQTIHSYIYALEQFISDDEDSKNHAASSKKKKYRLHFKLRLPDLGGSKFYIIDESSMIGNHATASFATFGSGRLLEDLLYVCNGSKILFCGDPFQLRPVGDPNLPAMDEAWFKERGYPVCSFSLKEVIRHAEDSGILELAGRLRSMQNHLPEGKMPYLPARDLSGVHLISDNKMLYTYFDYLRRSGFHRTIAIAHTQKHCRYINDRIRALRFGFTSMPLLPGDILIVTQNNQLYPLYNGDFVEVIEVGESHTYCRISFVPIRVKTLAENDEFEILFCDEIIKSGLQNLTIEQQHDLLVDFMIRCKKKGLDPEEREFIVELRKDPYLNSLRATYGYAITCHKAQGGEWDHVFTFLNPFMGKMGASDLIRWFYTATTRAKKDLFINMDSTWIV